MLEGMGRREQRGYEAGRMEGLRIEMNSLVLVATEGRAK